jgi:hypothetical protein
VLVQDKPVASISLNLDNLWTYLKTHGNPAWEARPTFLREFLPMALDVCDAAGIRITFFVIGLDAEREENAEVLQEITRRGHEIANHSFEHEPWLQSHTKVQLADDVARAEEAIVRVTGQRPIGFRGPAYSWSPALLEVLEERGYVYDASALPTYVGPLARAYYFRTTRFNARERARRRALFGTFRDGRRPVAPYWWLLGEGRALLEIPITTLPGIKMPFHLSYLLYLSRYSEWLALSYLRLAVGACRLAGIEPSFLLHPLDLLGSDQAPELKFFPGMDLPGERKRKFFLRALGVLGESFTLVTMSAHAAALRARWNLHALYPASLAVVPPPRTAP